MSKAKIRILSAARETTFFYFGTVAYNSNIRFNNLIYFILLSLLLLWKPNRKRCMIDLAGFSYPVTKKNILTVALFLNLKGPAYSSFLSSGIGSSRKTTRVMAARPRLLP